MAENKNIVGKAAADMSGENEAVKAQAEAKAMVEAEAKAMVEAEAKAKAGANAKPQVDANAGKVRYAPTKGYDFYDPYQKVKFPGGGSELAKPTAWLENQVKAGLLKRV